MQKQLFLGPFRIFIQGLLLVSVIACATGCASVESKNRKKPTSELLLRHRQLTDYLNNEKKDWEIQVGHPLFMGDGGRKDRIKEREAIEVELLRRYEAGDQLAKPTRANE